LYALDEESGAVKWSYGTSGGITGTAAVMDGVVYVGSLDGHFYALDVSRGRLKWKFDAGGGIWSGPAVANGIVYVGSLDDSLYAVDGQSGDLVWTFQAEDDIFGSPTVADGTLYFTSNDDYVYALSASTGELYWKAEMLGGALTRPTLSDEIIFVGSFDWRIYAMEAETGSFLWNYQTEGSVWSSPVENEGTVFAGSDDGYVYALDARLGKLKWRFRTGDKVRSSPTVSGGIVYVGSYSDSLYALDADSGAMIWMFESGDDVDASPAPTVDTVYAGSHDNVLYALRAGIPPGVAYSTSSTFTPAPTPEFVPLSEVEARGILDTIFSTDLPAVGGTASSYDGDTVTVTELSFIEEAVSLFETGYYLLTGAPSGLIPRVLSREEYLRLVVEEHDGDPVLLGALAFCCERGVEGLELIIDGSSPTPRVVGSLAHEAGHARQEIRNPGQDRAPRASNVGTLREAEAFAFQAALIRRLGEYTGVNATVFPFGYKLREWVEGWTADLIGSEEDVTQGHLRATGLLWAAVLHDPSLVELKAELSADGILSPESLLLLHDRLVEIESAEADAYVESLLATLRQDSGLIEETILRRNGTVPEGFFKHNKALYSIFRFP
jgi:outer membrane protein assembly factor BamB